MRERSFWNEELIALQKISGKEHDGTWTCMAYGAGN